MMAEETYRPSWRREPHPVRRRQEARPSIGSREPKIDVDEHRGNTVPFRNDTSPARLSDRRRCNGIESPEGVPAPSALHTGSIGLIDRVEGDRLENENCSGTLDSLSMIPNLFTGRECHHASMLSRKIRGLSLEIIMKNRCAYALVFAIVSVALSSVAMAQGTTSAYRYSGPHAGGPANGLRTSGRVRAVTRPGRAPAYRYPGSHAGGPANGLPRN